MSTGLFEYLKVFLVVLLCITILSCSSSVDPKPVVEEGLFINEIYAAGDDWLELYNDLEVSKDIGGYFIYDDPTIKYKLPLGTTIPAKGFLVLLCNDLATGLNTNFKLTSNGETVYLENKEGALINSVTFPSLNNGQSYGRYPDGSTTLAISGFTTQGFSNGKSQSPAIDTVFRSSLIPFLNQSVTVTAKLLSNADIVSVKLIYRFDGGAYTELNMSLTGDSYTANIPAKATTGLVEYYIEAKGQNGNGSYKPASAPAKVYSYLLNTDPLPVLLINEFLAFNLSCCPDTDSGVEEYDDWIEIYNKGSVAVNIGGMYLSDDLTNPFNHRIPTDNAAATTIQPGGYLVLWADNDQSQGPLHLKFALNSAGEEIGLFYLDGRTIDSYSFGPQSENISWGRVTDGANTWKAFNVPTRGLTNQ